MKNKNFSRILAILLTLAALMSLSVFAVEGETGAPTPVEVSAEEGIEPHGVCNGNHVWTTYSTGVRYTNLGASGHEVRTLRVRECTLCGVVDSVGPLVKRESHSCSYTRLNEYHQGNQHVAVYKVKCSLCAYEVRETREGDCFYDVTGQHTIP